MTLENFLTFYKNKPNEKDASICYIEVEKALKAHGIFSINTIIGAMATIRVEAGSAYKPVRENLNYSAATLLKVFPTRFDSVSAAKFANKPELIANKIYANRYGNGNETSGDGWKYRGANFLQHTFKDNWKELGLTEQNCLDVKTGANALALYFKNRKCNIACDAEDWTKVRKLVNGGSNGLEEFLNVIKQFKNIK